MKKSKADTLALMLTRDILGTPTQTQSSQMTEFSEYNAKELGAFIRTLSAELESLDENTDVIRLLSMYQPESK
ncbi:TPA: hypothetical protein ACUM3L_000262 [Haemophilus influenzae]|uniref:hypothetical protein n=1 Tax=Haemophilus influenzae TaxID=727 RepID=UPI0005AF0368|nr:hypothetical protein [Haemophilus influenzae]KIP36613.1 hypothetical protein SU51_00425 [Haemophilus influenzae]MCK8951231.1 hypothetical protein [Haemophilus influenzae]MCK8973565.1 hypothetical protein [Haemophilus influenzae]MCK9086501.1 hypothetical protein [Haemophilus influenzae]MCK9106114.1 hypothetical protein [Haemophilus influenzae]